MDMDMDIDMDIGMDMATDTVTDANIDIQRVGCMISDFSTMSTPISDIMSDSVLFNLISQDSNIRLSPVSFITDIGLSVPLYVTSFCRTAITISSLTLQSGFLLRKNENEGVFTHNSCGHLGGEVPRL
jgi:hypothetical protein